MVNLAIAVQDGALAAVGDSTTQIRVEEQGLMTKEEVSSVAVEDITDSIVNLSIVD